MLDVTETRTLTISGPALPEGPGGVPMLQLRCIDGGEALSEIYTYTLDCLTAPELPPDVAANIDLKSMIGRELTVEIQLEGMGSFVSGLAGVAGMGNIGAGTREISGIVAHARYVGQSHRQSRYELILKPWIWLADQSSDFRIFQRKTVVQIIREVFGKYFYSYDERLGEQYPMLDYQVQYGETDYRFVQRLLAEYGIYWFFEHSNTVHRLVLVDHLGSHRPVDSEAYHTLPYYPPGHRIDMEYVDHFDLAGSLQAGRWTTNDFDFKQPGALLSARNELIQDTANNDLERYEWPGDYTELQRGKDVARLRMEEIRAHGERAQGSGALRNVVCGTTFNLEGYPYQAANQEYLVISALLHASELEQSSGGSPYHFQTSFTVQPATTVFRPQRNLYPKPHTSGPQTAIVTGAPGSEIWTDQYGRVKLKFHWDRSDVNDDNSSCWIRVSYPWAGGGFGGVNVPRVGTEVIVDFENGDPDRPIVVGRLYNAATMPPWDLPGNATQSGLISRSMKGGAGNANAIRFEDKQGGEQLWLQAERDMKTEVENNEEHSVLNDRNRKVGNNETIEIANDRSQSVGGNHSLATTGNETSGVGGGMALTVGVLPPPDAAAPPAGTYTLKATQSIVLECGASKITMQENGLIKIEGVQIEETAKGLFAMKGKRIDLNK
ncbi:type VI secretion system Vgr family protein [Paraburkholderia azotifigens]|uniref:Type VI secretion system tip protein TssI/VgrG n=1 Tax=Paraburkholderia azotifigens TaxID=2057004 RepID=A0A5C6V8E1_9BURK|nr:type VI secretion system tip protein TssI/VgrG [Paraburkholderia azotifigens]TXC80118.1 type VI secretion system tip protein VgrG [Paraburkholderia azotifigens]